MGSFDSRKDQENFLVESINHIWNICGEDV